MKTKQLLATCLMIAAAFAATAQNHQTFKGVPIDGKTSAFVNQLKQKGFQTVGKTDTLIGTFAGYNDCEVTVLSSAQTDNVYGARVQIPMCAPLLIYTEYKKLQIALTEKYGEPVKPQNERPTKEEEDFVTALGQLIVDVKESFEESFVFPYSSVYNTDRGSVTLNGSFFPATKCGGGYIIITYIDKANNTVHQQSIYDDL